LTREVSLEDSLPANHFAMVLINQTYNNRGMKNSNELHLTKTILRIVTSCQMID